MEAAQQPDGRACLRAQRHRLCRAIDIYEDDKLNVTALKAHSSALASGRQASFLSCLRRTIGITRSVIST